MDKQHIDNFQYQNFFLTYENFLNWKKHGWKNRETELEQITDYQIAKPSSIILHS